MSTSVTSPIQITDFLNPHQKQPSEEEVTISFSTAASIPVDVIFPFFSLDELDVLCRVSKAFEKSLLLLSTTLVVDMHKRAIHILFSDNEVNVQDIVEKYFPKQVLSAQKKNLPRNLYTRLIKKTSPEVFNPLVKQIEKSPAYSTFGDKLKPDFIKTEIFYKVYRALHKQGITIAHQWAFKARLLREERIDNWTMQTIFNDLVHKAPARYFPKEADDEWLPVALLITAEIPDPTTRNTCQEKIVDLYLEKREPEKIENLLQGMILSEDSRGDYLVDIAGAYIKKGKIDKAEELLKNIISCQYPNNYQKAVYELAAKSFEKFLTDSHVYLNKPFLKDDYNDSWCRKELVEKFVNQKRLKDALTVIATMPPSDNRDKETAIAICIRCLVTYSTEKICEFLSDLPSSCAEELGAKVKTLLEQMGKPSKVINEWLIKCSFSTPPAIKSDPGASSAAPKSSTAPPIVSSTANASSSALVSSTTSSTTPAQEIRSMSGSLPTSSPLPIAPSQKITLTSSPEPSITAPVTPPADSVSKLSPALSITPVATTESSAPSDTSNPIQSPTQPVLPLAPNADKPEPMQTTSLLSSYWNDSMLFRIFSILSLGLLPLAVCLWEACCMSTIRPSQFNNRL